MESQLALLLDQDLSGVLHELTAGDLDVVGEGSSEHHDLLVDWGLFEDLLNVTTHSDTFEHFVALVKDEHLNVARVKSLVTSECKNSAWGADYDVRGLVALEELLLRRDWLATVNDFSADRLEELGQTVELSLDLVSKLTGMAENERAAGFWVLS